MDTPITRDAEFYKGQREDRIKTVEDGVVAFDQAESALDTAFARIRRIRRIIERANRDEMLGSMKTMRMKALLDTLAGRVAAIKLDLVELHEQCTAVAIEHGVDVPQARGGGNR